MQTQAVGLKQKQLKISNAHFTWGDLKWTLSTTTVTQILEKFGWVKGVTGSDTDILNEKV